MFFSRGRRLAGHGGGWRLLLDAGAQTDWCLCWWSARHFEDGSVFVVVGVFPERDAIFGGGIVPVNFTGHIDVLMNVRGQGVEHHLMADPDELKVHWPDHTEVVKIFLHGGLVLAQEFTHGAIFWNQPVLFLNVL